MSVNDDKLDELQKQLNDATTYQQLFNIHIRTQKLKIDTIKRKMNEYVNNECLKKNGEFELPDYLNNILSMLTETYPIIKKYHTKIIYQLNFIDKFYVHPLIFQSLFSNLIHTVFICELLSDDKLVLDKTFTDQLLNIQSDISITFSIFNNIFMSIDDEYTTIESTIEYNKLNSMPIDEFIGVIDNETTNKNFELNRCIVNLEHMTEHVMNEFSSTLCNSLQTCDKTIIINKFDADVDMLQKFLILYGKSIKTNMNQMNIHIDNILKLCGRNAIYYWIDTVALMNGLLLDKLMSEQQTPK